MYDIISGPPGARSSVLLYLSITQKNARSQSISDISIAMQINAKARLHSASMNTSSFIFAIQSNVTYAWRPSQLETKMALPCPGVHFFEAQTGY